MNVLQVQNLPQTQRVLRKPNLPFAITQRAMEITPFFMAPVLAGETLKNALWQSRAVSMPVKAPLSGWWLEHYVFYVKLRDLDAKETIEEMMLNINADTSTLKTGVSSVPFFETSGNIPWMRMCMKRITEEYFRDDGETWDTEKGSSTSLPLAKHKLGNAADSMYRSDEIPDPALALDVNDDVNLQDFDLIYNKWIFARAQKITEMDFEDYLRTFGVSSNRIEQGRPELIRYTKNWTYPSNTVNPSDGTPSSAVSWSIQERADKDRYFLEPGFLVGVTIARPKVFVAAHNALANKTLEDALSWLPAVMKDAPHTSFKEFAAGDGPFAGTYPNTATPYGYWMDVRDLFVHGDQFTAIDASSPSGYFPVVKLKTASKPTHSQLQYLDNTDLAGLFVDNTKPFIHQDGAVSLSVLGTQTDQT